MNIEVVAFNPVNAPLIVGTPLARYVAPAPMVTFPECVIGEPAFKVKFPFSVETPEMVVAPEPAKVAEPPTFVVKAAKELVAELLNVTAEATTTGPAKVMALVPDKVCVLVEKV